MLIYDVLKMDHRMVIDVLDAIEMVTDHSRRKDMFAFVRTELIMHSKAEEDTFYTPLKARMTDPLLIDALEDDHHLVEKLLMKLQMSMVADDEWMDTLRDLRAALQRHILTEENDSFHIARHYFSTIEAADMATRFIEGKGRLGMENPVAMVAHKVKEMMS